MADNEFLEAAFAELHLVQETEEETLDKPLNKQLEDYQEDYQEVFLFKEKLKKQQEEIQNVAIAEQEQQRALEEENNSSEIDYGFWSCHANGVCIPVYDNNVVGSQLSNFNITDINH
jgi:uncharacterized protein YlxW (UPF0749 family)